MASIKSMLLTRQLRWTGHLVRMDVSRLTKAVFYGELVAGFRHKCCPKLRYKDCTKRNLQAAGIPLPSWENSAKDRPTWRSLIKHGASAAEDSRNRAAEERRTQRHIKMSNTVSGHRKRPFSVGSAAGGHQHGLDS